MTYESVVRFQLPDGEHHPLRLRLQAEAQGKLQITIYESTPLETPGEAIRTVSRDLAREDLSDGKDGRWVVEDLIDMRPLKGVVWVGVRKVAGSTRVTAPSDSEHLDVPTGAPLIVLSGDTVDQHGRKIARVNHRIRGDRAEYVVDFRAPGSA